MSEQEEYQNPDNTNKVQPKKLSDVVKFLVIANVIVYILHYLLAEYNGLDLYDNFALYNFRSDNFQIYQFITHMFLHAGFFHIFLNMFILWMFGSTLEYVWNSKKFLFYYFFTGVGAGLLHLSVTTISISQLESTVEEYLNNPTYNNYTEFVAEEIGEIPAQLPPGAEVFADIRSLQNRWENDPQNEKYRQESKAVVQSYFQFVIDRPSMGASGAVFGVLLAFGLLFPNALIYIYFLFPVKAKYLVIFLGLMELYVGVVEENNVANFAHLGGMIFGFLLIKFWGEKARN